MLTRKIYHSSQTSQIILEKVKAATAVCLLQVQHFAPKIRNILNSSKEKIRIQRTISHLKSHFYFIGHDHKIIDPRKAMRNLKWTSANATLLILSGIIIEIGSLLWFPHNASERVIGVVAYGLIGFGFVFQYMVIGIAILASADAQRKSDEKVAAANERASFAETRTAEATLELIKLKAPRSFSSQQSDKIIQQIKHYAGTPYILSVANETEAINLLLQTNSLLRSANWSPQHPKTGLLFGLKLPGKPIVRSATVQGSWILIPRTRESEWRKAANVLANGLCEVGISIDAVAVDVPANEQHAINIVIGTKP